MNFWPPLGTTSLKLITFQYLSLHNYFVSSFPGQGRGALRFYDNGQTSTTLQKGIVQIFYDSKWSNICDGGFTGTYTPNTICRQLGYGSGETVDNSA